MVSLKRAIAALIVCFKPHVLLTLCILLVIAHSIIIAIQKGASNSWRVGKQHDFTVTMTTLILVVALIWAAFFIFIVRFELRNELESLLILFQCSKRGLRFLGVVGFHVALLTLVSLIVSATVERSIPNIDGASSGVAGSGASQVNNRRQVATAATADSTTSKSVLGDIFIVVQDAEYLDRDSALEYKQQQQRKSRSLLHPLPSPGGQDLRLFNSTESLKSKQMDREYLLTVYKIWLTAIVYAFLYLIIENLVMFYADMTLVEMVHFAFLAMVAKVTGIDLSDYPAGEMLFNPLVRHRIR